MVSITCPCVECVYNGRGYKSTAKSINLKYRNMLTVNEGRVDMWVCDKYEISGAALAIDKIVTEMLRLSDDSSFQI